MSTLVRALREQAEQRAREAERRHREAGAEAPLVVYFSSVSQNTHRFAQRLAARTVRLPLRAKEQMPRVAEPYLLIVPSYGRAHSPDAVPPQVTRFLGDPVHRANLRGLIGAGNTNFGPDFCAAADQLAAAHQVPVLHRIELMGTEHDIELVEGLMNPWQ